LSSARREAAGVRLCSPDSVVKNALNHRRGDRHASRLRLSGVRSSCWGQKASRRFEFRRAPRKRLGCTGTSVLTTHWQGPPSYGAHVEWSLPIAAVGRRAEGRCHYFQTDLVSDMAGPHDLRTPTTIP